MDIEPSTHVYTYDPEVLIEAIRSEAACLDIAVDTLHFEQFAIENETDDVSALVLTHSGREFVIPEKIIALQVIENNKAAKVECLCHEGVCGICETVTLEDEVDRRNRYFNSEERVSQ